MQNDLRFCAQGCCHFVNNQAVSAADYEKTVGRPVLGSATIEVLIPCRRNPGDLQNAVETDAGFYLGAQLKRAFGTRLPAGGAVVFDIHNGERLKDASDDDIAKWNAAWRRQVEGGAK